MKTHMNWKRIAALLLVCCIVSMNTVNLFSQGGMVSRGEPALKGYDPVAYFTLGEAREGDPEITRMYDGRTYRFISQEHRQMFIADPQAYLPEYDSYCAYAVAGGSLAPVDPEQWVIHQGRLFLNFNRRTQRRFVNDLEGMINSADENWPALQPRSSEDQ
ncbi:YHS domain-containing (seleno)protein [Salinispira pacifica]|uniref:YHS domain-containing (seleno)protein n=1 Tax=Salinispira pacifica TaxID=1307761 RepID=UPI0006A70843|nr:YHS domain-containing (seleno)protein [Salinispira pacifica]